MYSGQWNMSTNCKYLCGLHEREPRWKSENEGEAGGWVHFYWLWRRNWAGTMTTLSHGGILSAGQGWNERKWIDTQTHKRSNRLCESGGGWLSVMFSLMVEGEGDKRTCHWAGGLLHKTIPGSGRLAFIWKEWVKIGENYSFWNRDGFMGWPRHRPTPLLGLYLWVNKYLCCISFFYN